MKRPRVRLWRWMIVVAAVAGSAAVVREAVSLRLTHARRPGLSTAPG